MRCEVSAKVKVHRLTVRPLTMYTSETIAISRRQEAELVVAK